MRKLIYFLSKSACGSAKAIYTFDAMFVRAKIVLAKLSINSDSIAPFGSEEKFEGIASRHRDICESMPEHQAVKIFSNDFILSTSIFPVDAPINIFTQQARFAVFFISSILSFVVPK